MRAAVVAPAREVPRWFSWQWYWDDSILDDERLVRVDGLRHLSGNGFLASAGSTWAVTQTGVTAYRAE